MAKKKSDLPLLLYVEDDEVSREVVTMFLKNHYIVETASDGDEALKKISKQKYTAILMDINLCKTMGGIEVAKEIKRTVTHDSVPIIAVTAYSFKEDLKIILDGGCSHYITKPFNKDSLLEVIEKSLNE